MVKKWNHVTKEEILYSKGAQQLNTEIYNQFMNDTPKTRIVKNQKGEYSVEYLVEYSNWQRSGFWGTLKEFKWSVWFPVGDPTTSRCFSIQDQSIAEYFRKRYSTFLEAQSALNIALASHSRKNKEFWKPVTE